MKTLLFLICAFSILAGDTVTTINRPSYLGGGSVSTVKSNGVPIAKIVTTKQPAYLGGGSVSKVSTGAKTVISIVNTPKPVYLGSGATTKVK